MAFDFFRNKNRSSSEAGFTIVELMITVSVVGILASIAFPNYQNFISRSRQVEAKLTLSAAYTAEMSFAAEQNSFTTCLTDAGYVRPAQNIFYSVGFVATSFTCGSGTADCHLSDFVSSLACSAGAFPAGGFFIADRGVAGPPVSRAVFTATSVTNIGQNGFRISAVGKISSRGAAIFDIWSINEAKLITNDASGL